MTREEFERFVSTYDIENDPQEMLLEIPMSTEPSVFSIWVNPYMADFDPNEDVPW
jgi:hypothetical protein